MSFALVKIENWNAGYLIVSVIQMVLCAFVFLSLPLWKKAETDTTDTKDDAPPKPLTFKEIIAIPGAVPCLLTFFGYCSLELSTSLWASSYLVLNKGISAEIASGFASLFYIGITSGRGINGFLAMKCSDRSLIRAGFGIIISGILLILLPLPSIFALIGFIVIGLGCAPIYPCIIHMTPDIFGRDKSQAMIGVQMAFAYIGFCISPPLFGVIAEHITIALLPFYLLTLLALMAGSHEIMVVHTKRSS